MNMKLRHKLPKRKMKIKMGAAVEITYVDVKNKNSKTRGREKKIKKIVRKLRNGCFGNTGSLLWEYRQLTLYMISFCMILL
jgi:hypothetical protein